MRRFLRPIFRRPLPVFLVPTRISVNVCVSRLAPSNRRAVPSHLWNLEFSERPMRGQGSTPGACKLDLDSLAIELTRRPASLSCHPATLARLMGKVTQATSVLAVRDHGSDARFVPGMRETLSKWTTGLRTVGQPLRYGGSSVWLGVQARQTAGNRPRLVHTRRDHGRLWLDDPGVLVLVHQQRTAPQHT